MSQQPTKPEINPEQPIKQREGVNEPGSKPGYQQNDPARRDVSPGEKPERTDKEKQSEPTRKSPPDIQMS